MLIHSSRWAALALAAAILAPAADFNWNLPPGFPKPPVPVDNPMSASKVDLGRHLFYDRRISVNGKESCATCHRQELAFTDGRAHAEGATGQLHPRSSMSLVNVAYAPFLTWANPALASLEEQALVPMLGVEPIELGLKGHEQEFLRRIQEDPVYQRLFPEAFPEQGGAYTLSNVTKGNCGVRTDHRFPAVPLMTATAGAAIHRRFRTQLSAAKSSSLRASAVDVFNAMADGILHRFDTKGVAMAWLRTT